jgi:hypothetical protein
MSKVAGFIIGGIEIAVGIALVATGVGGPLGVELIIQGALTIAAQAIVDLTMPKTPARQCVGNEPAAGRAAARRAASARRSTPAAWSTPSTMAANMAPTGKCWSSGSPIHKCAGLTGFYVNDAIRLQATAQSPATVPSWKSIFAPTRPATPLPSIVTTHGPGWTSADVGESGCDVIVAYKADKPPTRSIRSGPAAARASASSSRALCYDPRKDSTVGRFGRAPLGRPHDLGI